MLLQRHKIYVLLSDAMSLCLFQPTIKCATNIHQTKIGLLSMNATIQKFAILKILCWGMIKEDSTVHLISNSLGKICKRGNFMLHIVLTPVHYIRICGQVLHVNMIINAWAEYVRIIHAKGATQGILAKTMTTVLAITTVASLIQRDCNGKCALQLKDKALHVN